MNLRIFSQLDFLPALKALFTELRVPMNYVADEPTTAKEILSDLTYRENETFQLMEDVYFVGMVDDAAFEGNKSLDAEKIKSDYDGILIFGITLKERPNALLPTRSQLAEIARAFNREFYYTPVVVVFKYGNHLAFANTERLKYKQEWREGEKAGKVSLLRDIHIEKPHSGHERILAELQIPTTGTRRVDSFAKLYAYWQEVFSVSLLNKKFYQELSNWYFWATQHVTFPGEPTIADAHHKNAKLEDLMQEHRATNVIRMLTRLLFVWFIKEKKLIPEDLFELDALQKDILNEISPYHERGMFKERNKESVYYKAILQNLFFATLNCPIEGDSLDKRKRGFRGDGYGTHRGIDYLMRYKQYFKNPDAFLKKLNDVVPFLNGGLFECLDDKFNNTYIDGFSDQMTKGEQLIVPDYLFFGVEEETDLSDIVGISDKKYKQAAVKGLINILKSYKFTITENTPIEEDVALDPELLGKVFENLLASYNPETKTTARKQTGSFYTPREIVNYMVDESLIAYLKNAISDWGGLDDETLDKELHVLTSFDTKIPFGDNTELQKEIITALSTCTILDPACGSGAFPMGILQKMVHILQKLDPENKVWKQVQLAKAEQESKAAFEIEDKQAREERLLEINEAFDQSINDPDYARKLFLIENCIYGVDIQFIATQISKLRFFISLVVEQKVNAEKDNFGIRPLPNLETKFVAANTLIEIEKPKEGDQLKIGSDNQKIESLKKDLAVIRHKLFSARTKETKLKYREKDQILRNLIAIELKGNFGWSNDAAEKLASWDPYDQNASSSFFDPEWMFDIKDGFDIVVSNPPYLGQKGNKEVFQQILFSDLGQKFHQRRMDLFYFFFHFAIEKTKEGGIISFITTNYYLTATYSDKLRQHLKQATSFINIIDFNEYKVFESAAGQHNLISILQRQFNPEQVVKITTLEKVGLAKGDELTQILDNNFEYSSTFTCNQSKLFENKTNYIRINNSSFDSDQGKVLNVILKVKENGVQFGDFFNVEQGIVSGADKVTDKHLTSFSNSWKKDEGIFILTKNEAESLISRDEKIREFIKPTYKNSDISKWFFYSPQELFVIYIKSNGNKAVYPKVLTDHLDRFKEILVNRNLRAGKVNLIQYDSFVAGKIDLSYVMNASSMKKGNYYCLSYARNGKDTFEQLKIVNSRRAKSNIFALEDKNLYEQSDIVVTTIKNINNNPFSILYALGLLNSKLYYQWFYHLGKRKGELLELFQKPITEVYIKEPSLKERLIVETIVSMIIQCKSNLSSTEGLEQILDGIVLELNFPDHMKERGIDVLEFVDRDINEEMKGKEFEKLSDTEKEQVIEQLHAKWSHPDNEVRNRIKLFAVRSPEILKPILES